MFWNYIPNIKCIKKLDIFKYVRSFNEFIWIYLGSAQVNYMKNYRDTQYKIFTQETNTSYYVEWGQFKYLDIED